MSVLINKCRHYGTYDNQQSPKATEPSRDILPGPPELEPAPGFVHGDPASEKNRSHENQGCREDGPCVEFVTHATPFD
jgi:hypothetical protein